MFAAHISEDKKREQSVQEHCLAAAESCAEYCRLFNAENIGRLCGLLHDVGKLCTDFDDYIRGNNSMRRGSIDHSYAGAKYITEIADRNTSAVARLIARVIISHHGIHDWVDEDYRDYFNMRISNDERYEEIKNNIHLIASEEKLSILLDKANQEYTDIKQKIKSINRIKEEAAFYLGLLERMIESALIDADRSDTAAFMDNIEMPESYGEKELWEEMKKKLKEKLDKFSERTDTISMQRKSISDRCAAFAAKDVHICRMIVPTGGGKTLSSLRFAIEYCIAHGMKKIFYTAPFMSILEQSSKEIRDIADDENFTEHHSNALAEIDDDAEEYKDYELHTERWDKPVIATTMVQLLNTFFLGKTSSIRRFHRLAKSVLIIDEVQSLPLKCINMFDLALNFLSYICGTVVVLCTATQPATDDVKHPIIIDREDSMTGDYNKDFEVFCRTEIIPFKDPYGYSYEEASEFCAEKFRQNNNLLVIVNTKSSALKLFSLIKEKIGNAAVIMHLSTNMCPQHRREKIEQLRSLLKGGKPVICVTTQLIEAGVDISFKCVVRSIAGLDNIVQAAGRCNRHGESEEKCPVYIVRLKEEHLGSLKEIESARDITQHMTEYGNYDDISSPQAVSDYFRLLYNKEKLNLSYSVSCNETLLNYLSLNENRYEMLPDPKTCSKYESQAFKTAGALFKVIDENTRDVIVPYNDEAKKYIHELESSNCNISQTLRKAQKYMVSVYNGTERKMYDSHAIRDLPIGAVVLDSAYYNDEFGVDLDGSEKEVLIF